jgi:hypothetical protein
MPLKACPHMTARCPHRQDVCQDAASKDCHYIKRTTASLMTAQVALLAANVEQLTPEMKEYLQKTEAFLKE